MPESACIPCDIAKLRAIFEYFCIEFGRAEIGEVPTSEMVQSQVLEAGSRSGGRVEAREPRAPLSKKLWDLDWSRILPWSFEEVTVESATFDDALPFIAEHYARIFGTEEGPQRFLAEPMTPAKLRFGAEMDVFVFRAEGKTVGVFMSHPSDWSTYYMRTAALLPEYRGRHLVSRFMERICEPLRDAGVVRLEGEVTPSNGPMMKLHVGQGFLATSTVSSERWGLVVRFTKYLREDAEAIFHRQFCALAVKSPKVT